MPTYMSLNWSDRSITAKVTPVGIKKVFRWYLSGELMKINLSITNDSDRSQHVGYKWALFRLAGSTQQRADLIKAADGDFELDAKRTRRGILRTAYLPQPGNYCLKLCLSADKEKKEEIEGDVLYFDALPKDATIVKVWFVVLSAIVGGIIGGLLVWFFGS